MPPKNTEKKPTEQPATTHLTLDDEIKAIREQGERDIAARINEKIGPVVGAFWSKVEALEKDFNALPASIAADFGKPDDAHNIFAVFDRIREKIVGVPVRQKRKKAKELDETDNKIVAFIEKQGRATTEEVQLAMDISNPTASKRLKALHKAVKIGVGPKDGKKFVWTAIMKSLSLTIGEPAK